MKFLLAATASLAISALSGSAVALAQDPVDFGAPPSGSVPLLFNDRHVYSKPDKVRAGRLLAAIVRNREILVPLRSLFEQMGATVTYDAASKTATLQSRTVRTSLTVGQAQITINGVVRPLDVPAELDDGQVLVPVRVLVETLGGYVQYLPGIRAVSVRYLPETGATAPPPPPASAAPSAPPVPLAKTPVARATVGPGPSIPVGTPEPETFVVANTLVSPRIANAAAPAVTGASGTSFDVSAAAEFTLVDINFDLGGGYEEFRYTHPAGVVTQPGGSPVLFEPRFVTIDRDYDAHLGVELSPQKYYLDFGYAVEHVNGYPRVGGLGVGFEKLPDLNRHVDFDFKTFYYPNMSGRCATCASPGSELAFKRFVYAVGLTYAFKPLFADVGYTGDKGYAKGAASDDFTHSGLSAGLGFRF